MQCPAPPRSRVPDACVTARGRDCRPPLARAVCETCAATRAPLALRAPSIDRRRARTDCVMIERGVGIPMCPFHVKSRSRLWFFAPALAAPLSSVRTAHTCSLSVSLPRALSLLVLHVFTCSALLSCVSVSVCPGLTKAVGGGAPPAPLAAPRGARRPPARAQAALCARPASMLQARKNAPFALSHSKRYSRGASTTRAATHMHVACPACSSHAHCTVCQDMATTRSSSTEVLLDGRERATLR